VLHEPKLKLEPKCSELLQRRMEMFNMALKVVPIQGLQDLLVQVSILFISAFCTKFHQN
jgi:hypothetical protein